MTLREYLNTTKTRQREFARKVGLSPQLISDLISGHRQPTLRVALLIEKNTDGQVTAQELLAGRIPPGYRLERIAPEPPAETEALP